MADSDTKPMLPEYADPNPEPTYYMVQSQPQQQPQFQPQHSYMGNSTFVITQQPAANMVTQVVDVPDRMGLAIFSCLCCFWPLGLAAIVMSCQSRDALGRGDVREAQNYSRASRVMSLISIVIGVLSIIIMIIIVTTRVRSTTYSSHGYN